MNRSVGRWTDIGGGASSEGRIVGDTGSGGGTGSGASAGAGTDTGSGVAAGSGVGAVSGSREGSGEEDYGEGSQQRRFGREGRHSAGTSSGLATSSGAGAVSGSREGDDSGVVGGGVVRYERYAARRSKTDQNGHTTLCSARLDAVFIEL